MEALKGYRTMIATWAAVGLGNIDIINTLIVKLAAIVVDSLSPGGAVASLITLFVTVKALFVDVVPKMKGTLPK